MSKIQMAALIELNSDCSKLPKAAIKKAIRKKLSSIIIYQIRLQFYKFNLEFDVILEM